MTIDGVKVKKITILQDGQTYQCKKGVLTTGEIVFKDKVPLSVVLDYNGTFYREDNWWTLGYRAEAHIPSDSGASIYVDFGEIHTTLTASSPTATGRKGMGFAPNPEYYTVSTSYGDSDSGDVRLNSGGNTVNFSA